MRTRPPSPSVSGWSVLIAWTNTPEHLTASVCLSMPSKSNAAACAARQESKADAVEPSAQVMSSVRGSQYDSVLGRARTLRSGDLSGKALLCHRRPLTSGFHCSWSHTVFDHRPHWVAEAASGLCGILWLIDESIPENALTSRLLRKVGAVVNLAGLLPEEIVSVLRTQSPDGVVAYCEDDIVLLSFVAAALGLDYYTPEVARCLVDKLCQREALHNGGLPTPLCWEVPADRHPAAIEALAAEVEYPAVLKPRSGSGSEYTMPVADAGGLG